MGDAHEARPSPRPAGPVRGGAGADPRSGPSGVASRQIVGIRVDGVTKKGAVDQIAAWSSEDASRYISVATVHLTMEAHDDPGFRDVINGADMVIPDGMPIVWGLRLQGLRGQGRVCGPDLTPLLCARAEADGIPVGFYGVTDETMTRLLEEAARRWPRLQVAYAYSPPFRDLSDEEERAVADDIARSGARLLFVGLGCPKQDWWTLRQLGRFPGVLLPVGAAFDFLAGTKSRPPEWIRRAGLEWVHRLISEPRRLWYRYLYHNPRFVALFVQQLYRQRMGGRAIRPQSLAP
jgi:N-acetylglucosaminyldiphosphoundecaprenol N-acetyl-beta-D-mannosaminyltransferase